MQVVLSLSGFKELLDELSQLEDRVAKQIARGAVKAGLEPILETAKELCPVSADGSHGNPPGYLRDSYVIKSLPAHKTHTIAAAITTRKGAFEPGKFYGGEQEFGTHDQPAHPHLRPAADQRKDDAIEVLKQHILAGIEGRKAFEAGQAVGESER
jgi:HK97 gp10 family phage protein